MKKLFEKHETLFCIALIALYVIGNSLCKKNFGDYSTITLIFNGLFTAALVAIMLLTNGLKYFGLVKPTNYKSYLFFIPLILLSTVNLWNGININNSSNEIIFYILIMINIGFIEEIIFRGFLFKMMAKDNVKIAILVSSLTFGIGHIVNLLTGADFIPTLIQVGYATSFGFLFVTIFYKSKSLIPSILAHIIINSTAIFNVENSLSLYIIPLLMIIISIGYALYLYKPLKVKNDKGLN